MNAGLILFLLLFGAIVSVASFGMAGLYGYLIGVTACTVADVL